MKNRNKKDRNTGGIKNEYRDLNFKFKSFFDQYGTKSNILKATGIVSLGGLAVYSAFKFIPFERLLDKIDEGFESINDAFQHSPQKEFALNHVEE